ncbi:hypothetical protein GOV09_05735 [Candidatus Woesearchaeota archaeon]|nr:hypothetical protein [Candidatus Woesearchaeota archaeon]
MPRMTVHIPDELMHKVRKQFPAVNWAAVVREEIVRKVTEIEKFEELKRKGVI